MQNKKEFVITYIFNAGREKFIISNDYSNEFLYFYNQVSEEYSDVEYIEVNEETNKNLFHNIYRNIEKIFSKILKVPLFSHKILNIQNIKRLSRSKHIVLTTENIGYSLAIFIFFMKMLKNFKVTVFFMGISNIKTNKLGELYTRLMFSNYDNLVFLSKGEKEHISKSFTKYKYKMHYMPFSIDLEFWKNQQKQQIKKNIILFNGNDLQRDYSFLQDLIDRLPQYKFIVLSKRFDTSSANVELLETNMRNPKISDIELKNLYSKCFVSIIPLIKTKQPSGQSVAMQSMAMGVPVVMTKTEGLWDKKLFKNEENIFLTSNNLKLWVEIIDKIHYESEIANQISVSALTTLKNNYSETKIKKNFMTLLEKDVN
jgi:glycosyltransferase involved in cell wall biosynthesis